MYRVPRDAAASGVPFHFVLAGSRLSYYQGDTARGRIAVTRKRGMTWLSLATGALASIGASSCTSRTRSMPAQTVTQEAPEPSYEGKPLNYWMQALTDPDKDTRVAAVSAIAKIGPKAQPAVPLLIEALKDKEKVVRTGSIAALGKIGPAAAEAIPLLAELSQDSDWATRSLAAAAMAAIQGKPLPEDDARDKFRSRSKRRRHPRPPS